MADASLDANFLVPFGTFLYQSSLINKGDLKKITNSEDLSLEDLCHSLLKLNIINAEDIELAKSNYYSVKHVDLTKYDPSALSQDSQFPENIARQYKCCVIAADHNNYVVAMTNPHNSNDIDYLSGIIGGYIQSVLVEDTQLHRHINNVFGSGKVIDISSRMNFSDRFNISYTEKDIDGKFLNTSDSVVLLDEIISSAYHRDASDIHIEYRGSNLSIRYRCDGVLEEQLKIKSTIAAVLVRRLLVMANLDIVNTSKPVDGRITTSIDNKKVNIRLSVVPLENGQSAVLRFLGDIDRYTDLDSLVDDIDVSNLINEYIQRTYGMLLIVGPTGSGKTTTQYATLMSMNRDEKKIISIEDPVEAYLPGVNQIAVNPEFGMDFSDILRSSLRQDPDVIMVGEIRDNITANMALRAAITGHMVMATVHTYDVASAITRLLDLGVDYHLISAAVRLVASQRLMRQLCPYCKKPYTVKKQHLALLHDYPNLQSSLLETKAYKAEGCAQCDNSGYSGRIGIFEILQLTPDIYNQINYKEDNFAEVIKSKIMGKDLVSQAFKRVVNGDTSIEEAVKVIYE